jgi:hypothetical protein
VLLVFRFPTCNSCCHEPSSHLGLRVERSAARVVSHTNEGLRVALSKGFDVQYWEYSSRIKMGMDATVHIPEQLTIPLSRMECGVYQGEFSVGVVSACPENLCSFLLRVKCCVL